MSGNQVTGPGSIYDVDGTLIAAGVAMPAGAAAGNVLTSDAAGNLAWQALPAATTSAAGTVTLDGTAADIQPAGVGAAGAVGKAADAGHVHPSKAVGFLSLEPAGAVGSTIPRALASASSAALTSGTVYMCAVALDKGVTVSNVSLFVAGTAESAGTHAWVGLADSSRVVKAVSADNTGAAYFGGTQTAVTTAVGTPYTTTAQGLYYVFACVVATTPPLFAAAPALENAGLPGIAPALCGSSSAAQTTPPALGATLGAITATAGHLFYAWLT